MTAMAHPALLYFLLWLGVSMSTAMDLKKRIFGGRDCPDNDYQHHVMLIISRGLCGGSLIRDQWVLTADHCWEPGENITAYVNAHPGQQEEPMVFPNTDAHVHLHPQRHDIMLLKLPARPRNIHNIALPTAAQCRTDDIPIGQVFRVAGYGASALKPDNEYFYQYPPTLKCIDMPVVDCAPIRINLREFNPFIPFGNFFCTHVANRDTGKGDSGGGVVFNKRIHGIVTGGHPTHAFVEPSFFLRVCKYLDWIEDTIANNP